ncbi:MULTISPECIES: type 1 fimbrial major subunit FimA [Providencia]|uniref:Type 1 fimbriae major subunit n=1 Tax=Providencia heimbachae ATCC 35613 TaxID=1354272 RepID=A0A1B7JUF4_9GAMM|nr:MULTISPECIES: type 1 fimbrial major subunit FimA [Providencia]MBP6123886.1 type 1 fimbrial major subunit FimA [Providencia sp.]NIH20880.1 fimbrial protein [Providencia heimbachae]OAT51344.1 type 1 fimbriae major subunit [Providencia heimbachae ATCC 35613]QCJ68512.1 type-1 fimbrial protein subunit A [Providencia heimbachae]SQH11507.1 Fimbrial subunit type 1 precursor [Providencia heimbachae]
MKVKSLALVVVSALSLSSVAAFAATTTVNGGTVHFKGELVNAACAVDADSVEQTVRLGQFRTAKLAQAGDTSGSVGFNIQLNDCDSTVATSAKIAFTGVSANAANPTVLSVASSASGAATNVGIQILDSKSTPLGLDGATFSSAITLKDGTNILPFQARYYALGATTAGVANADATFAVQYE